MDYVLLSFVTKYSFVFFKIIQLSKYIAIGIFYYRFQRIEYISHIQGYSLLKKYIIVFDKYLVWNKHFW